MSEDLLDKKVFISHSSLDSEFVLLFNEFLIHLGIGKDDIFCSSIEGQGVKQGKRIDDSVKLSFIGSTILVFILSKNFFGSQACQQELGAGWINTSNKRCFYIKLDDITMDEIKGFISNTYKFTFITPDSLAEFIDDISEFAELPNKKATEVTKIITSLITKSSGFIDKIVKEKEFSDSEKAKQFLEKLLESVAKLNLGEKKILAYTYFSEDQCQTFEVTSGVVNLLTQKNYIYRLSTISQHGMYFPYTLQPWIKEYIDEHPDFKEELKKIMHQETHARSMY